MRKTLILSVVFGFAPAVAAAQPDRFRGLDRNGDGFISSQEWYGQSRVPVPFTVVDADGDGTISEGELRDWSAARGGATRMGLTSADRFRILDQNRDRFISPEEWNDAGYGSVPFEAVDSDMDRRISTREFSEWDRRRGGPAATTPAPPQTPGTAAPPGAERLRSDPMRGVTGVTGRAGIPAASPSAAPPTAAPPAVLSTSPGATPGSSPSMSTGSGLTK